MKLVAFLTLLSSALIPAALADSTVTITPGRYLELDTGAVSSTRGRPSLLGRWQSDDVLLPDRLPDATG